MNRLIAGLNHRKLIPMKCLEISLRATWLNMPGQQQFKTQNFDKIHLSKLQKTCWDEIGQEKVVGEKLSG